MGSLFELRGNLERLPKILLGIGGALFILLVWILITAGENPMVEAGICPKPLEVFHAFGELFEKNELIKNLCRSLGYNLSGYVVAILISIPIGFIIGLFPFFRSAFQKPIDALRYVPLPAAIGIFIAWFGIGTSLKVNFLAFGILIYLIPVVVQRIDEVKAVYLKTVYTLGATDWQTIKTVYFPSVMSRLSDDIRVLTAISWTYIIIAESIGGEGGIGNLIWRVGSRRGRIDMVFALLIVIMIIGILQDNFFTNMDRKFFPFKFQDRPKKSGIWQTIWGFVVEILVGIYLLTYAALWLNSFTGMISEVDLIDYLFSDTKWVFHFIFLLVLFFKCKGLYLKRFFAPTNLTTA